MKRKTSKYSHKGGNFFTSSNNSSWNDWFNNMWSQTKEKSSSLYEEGKNVTKSAYDSSVKAINNSLQSNPSPAPSAPEQPNRYIGGKKSRRNKYGGSKAYTPQSIASSATTITGIKTAQPNYWIKGGKRTRKHKKTIKKRR